MTGPSNKFKNLTLKIPLKTTTKTVKIYHIYIKYSNSDHRVNLHIRITDRSLNKPASSQSVSGRKIRVLEIQ